MNIPKAMTLFSDDGYHAGFMLLAPKSNERGNCVFMLTPVSKEGIDSNLGIVVSELKVAGEHKFICTKFDGSIELTVQPEKLPDINFILDSDFRGKIFTELNEKRTLIGTVEPAKKKSS